ncbi:unnamed protein product [Sympodiomycopsis kandeliae]
MSEQQQQQRQDATAGTSSTSPPQPPSPRLQPRAHRPSSSLEMPESSSSKYSLNSGAADEPSSSSASSSLSPSEAAGSPVVDVSSTSSPASFGSNSDEDIVGSSDPASADMTSSIISNLDLDSSSSGQSQSIDTSESDQHIQRIPLVREDTATRRAMRDINLEEEEEEETGDDDPVTVSNTFQNTQSSTRNHEDDDDDENTTEGEDNDSDVIPHQPKTTSSSNPHQPETVPTVSSTGMPRFLPRSLDDPTKQDRIGSKGPPPPELQPESEPKQQTPNEIPTGSLTLSALSPSSKITFTRRVSILSASIFINLGLPFINGVMLGFGEIFARSLIAPVVLGFVGTRWPSLRQQNTRSETNTSSRTEVVQPVVEID